MYIRSSLNVKSGSGMSRKNFFINAAIWIGLSWAMSKSFGSLSSLSHTSFSLLIFPFLRKIPSIDKSGHVLVRNVQFTFSHNKIPLFRIFLMHSSMIMGIFTVSGPEPNGYSAPVCSVKYSNGTPNVPYQIQSIHIIILFQKIIN